MNPSIIFITVIFGLIVGSTIFALGYFVLEMGFRPALLAGAILGFLQSAGGLAYIWYRFKGPACPPRDGGTPG